MLISRALVTKNKDLKALEQSINLPRLFQQGKQISQIISYIWLWGGDSNPNKDDPNFHNAKELKEYFAHPHGTPEYPHRTLNALFSAIPNPDGNREDQLLYAVFPYPDPTKYPRGYFFPIYNEGERKHYLFDIDTNKFQGTIEDANENTPELMRILTPFPPCPKFSAVTVTTDELKVWIENRDPQTAIANNPYIPTCTS